MEAIMTTKAKDETKGPERRGLTDAFVKKVEKRASRFLVWDKTVRRLALCVQPSGAKSYKVIYCLRNRVRWLNLGRTDTFPVKEARRLAQKLLGEVAMGQDPAAEKQAARAAGTFAELHARYLNEHAKRKNKSWKQGDFLVRKYLLPKWGKLPAASIKRSDVWTIFNKLSDHSPTLANQVLASGSAIFTWAIKNEVASLAVNPFRGVSANETLSRERHLSTGEVPIIWNGLDELDLMRGRALRMVLLTAARPGEVRHMRFEHLEFGKHHLTDPNGRTVEREGCWWSLPGAPQSAIGWPGTKNGRATKVWLSPLAVSIIDEVGDRKASGYVFSSARGGPVGALDAAMVKLCARLGIKERVRPHDLRRSGATLAAAAGFGRQALDRLLNHADNSVTAVYDQHTYQFETMTVAEAINARIMSLVAGETEKSKVVQLRA
jgi:integrase